MWLSLFFLFWVGPPPQEVGPAGPDPLKAHVEALSDDALEGRNAGSPGARLAAEYIVGKFREYGLLPGPGGSYVQRFSFPVSHLPGINTLHVPMVKGMNLLGVVEGSTRREEVVMVITHYDHLGKTSQPNPGRGKEAEGDSIWNGANDNASGVASLLSLARSVSEEKPERTILFVAFSAKEHQLHGSLWYKDHPLIPLKQVVLVVALDRIGLSGKLGLEIHGAGSGGGIRPILEDTLARGKFSARVFNHADVRSPVSDHVFFFEEGVPTLFVTVPPQDTDRTSRDHSDRIDYPVLEQRTRLVHGILRKVDEAPGPFPFVRGRRLGFLQGGVASLKFAESVNLNAQTGAILVIEVRKDSVAAKAGLKKGDWLLGLNGVTLPRSGAVRVLRRVLDGVPTGRPVPLEILREKERLTLKVEWSE